MLTYAHVCSRIDSSFESIRYDKPTDKAYDEVPTAGSRCVVCVQIGVNAQQVVDWRVLACADVC